MLWILAFVFSLNSKALAAPTKQINLNIVTAQKEPSQESSFIHIQLACVNGKKRFLVHSLDEESKCDAIGGEVEPIEVTKNDHLVYLEENSSFLDYPLYQPNKNKWQPSPYGPASDPHFNPLENH